MNDVSIRGYTDEMYPVLYIITDPQDLGGSWTIHTTEEKKDEWIAAYNKFREVQAEMSRILREEKHD